MTNPAQQPPNPESPTASADGSQPLADRVTWSHVLRRLPRVLFVGIPQFILFKVTEPFRDPATDDELYGMITGVLQAARGATTADGFDESVETLHPYLRLRCRVDNKKLTRAQWAYAEIVRKACVSRIREVRTIVEQLNAAAQVPDLARFELALTQLDTVFRPMDGQSGFEAFKRVAQSAP